jgi:charged multivesicular body protein 2A
MDFLFGSRKTPQEMLRENQRMITRSVRELDRERTKLEQQEKKLVADIKKAAKAGQMVLCHLRLSLSLFAWLYLSSK